jgi:glycosyltransferase involved in cell wall biosynthesis
LKEVFYGTTMAETVAVIIPVYNGAAYLQETLKSVFGQNRLPDEVIVVDDGSTDVSLAIAEGFPQVKCLSQGNKGVPTARNMGVKASSSTALAFLDQDDYWAPEKLELQLSVLEGHPEVGIVICQQVFFLDEGVQRPAWLKPEILESPQAGNTPSALVARRSIFERVGYFDPGFETASDVDWFFRLKDAGIKSWSVPEALVFKRVHSGNQSNLVRSLHAEYLQLARASVSRQKEA